MVATFIPPLLKIVGKLGHLGGPTMRRLSFWKLPPPQPAPDGLPFHPQRATDSRLRLASLKQGDDLLVALQSPLSAQLRLCGSGRRGLRSIGADAIGIGGLRSCHRILDGRQDQLPASLLQHPLHGRREIHHEMEPIGNLLRLRRPERRPFGIKTATISRDRCDFRMLLKPFREALDGAIG